MPALNTVHLLGNLTRDPEVKYLQSGLAVCDLGMAVNERVKKREEWVDETTFVDVTLFGKTAEVAGEYLGKGAQVLIVGKLRLEQWEKDGQKRSKLKVVAESMQMLGGRTESKRQQAPTQREFSQAPPPPPDDTPF